MTRMGFFSGIIRYKREFLMSKEYLLSMSWLSNSLAIERRRSVGMVSKDLPKDQAAGVQGKVREGKTGTSNKDAAKGLKDADKAGDDFKPGATPTPTPGN
ncbi:hypothetical protein NP522_19830 [Pseudomonas guariconensis]|uniref:hypothetical protein n=1 Tax=Pseudomonas guariconensis TaxID=1288410 RepID=UPI0023646F05|nr:hypothetical protein [Pseudomonas guariconensis]MDD2092438.1 hypothetical protein [Pseudomonas guariconensis]